MRVPIEAEFPRHDPLDGRRYAEPVELQFTGVRIKTGRRRKESDMAAHAGERARETGTFHCASCDGEVHVKEGEKIPEPVRRKDVRPSYRRAGDEGLRRERSPVNPFRGGSPARRWVPLVAAALSAACADRGEDGRAVPARLPPEDSFVADTTIRDITVPKDAGPRD